MYKLNCLLIIMVLAGLPSFILAADATTATTTTATAKVKTADDYIADQQTACAKNTAMEWSSALNRCVGKQAAIDARNEAQACDALKDVTAKANCHLALAEKNSKLSSDPSKLNQGSTTNSMLMNGVAAAYSAINIISSMGKNGEQSNCTSKKILGVTSVAGLASDVYLKMSAKKKVKELEGKYKLDTTTASTEAQVQALQYLKEEQQTVVSIAGMEKKRNLMLMLGYGMAAGWAVYEMTPFGANPDCVKPNKGDEVKASADAKPAAATATGTTPVTPEYEAETFSVIRGDVETTQGPTK